MQQKNYFKNKPEFQTDQKERLLGKMLPAQIEAEKSVLGAVLLDDTCFSIVEETLRVLDFYVPAHQNIYSAMLDLSKKNQRIDFITLQDALEKLGQLAGVGDVPYLIELQENIPAFGMLEQHVKIIRTKSMLRNLISSSLEIITSCYSQQEADIDYVIDEAEKKLFNMIHNRSQQNFVQLNIWLKKTFQHLSSVKSSSKGVTGVSSSFKTLDKYTSGFQPGDLIIVAARPSMGKTSLALNIAVQSIATGLVCFLLRWPQNS